MKKKKLKILIVDDEFTSRVILNRFLVKYGECHMAVDGSEAIQACAMADKSGRPYDLICMDIMMPGTDGLTALKTIRASDEKTRIIMITAVNRMQCAMASFEELCDAYMTKPVQRKQLLETMKNLELL